MFASIPRRHAHLSTAARRPAARLHRPAAALAAITCSVLISAGLIPAAWASTTMIPLPPGGGTGPAVPAPAVRVITTGGMAGWQITLIAVGAALAAAAMAILLDRARAARRTARATTASPAPASPEYRSRARARQGPGAARPGEIMVTNPNPAEDADRARDDQPVTDLVNRARNGDKQAWDTLVDRYAPLIWSVCRRYRLDDADADDVGQNVWLLLVIHLGKLADPAALPGWLVTTTRRECIRARRAAARASSIAGQIPDIEATPDQHAVTVEQELLRAEQHAVMREALRHLPQQGQQLIALLIADPRLSYAEISAKLGIPTGSIGPNRRRYLDKLRSYPAVAGLIDDSA